MSEIRLPFEVTEYAARLEKLRAAMARQNLDTLVLSDPSNMAWVTGYDGWSFYVHQAVIVRHDGDPLWWGRAQDANGARRTVWMRDDCVTSYADHFVQSAVRHPMEELGRLLARLGAQRVGLEMDNYYFSAKAHVVLRDALPGVIFRDATALCNWQRTVKSAAELAYMRQAARISEKIVDGLLERVEPGVPKNEVVAEIYRDAIHAVDGIWGDYPAIVPLLPSGDDASAPHLTWDGRLFAEGEATFFEISGCVRRYHAPLCRTLFLGTPPDQMRRAEAALVEGLEAGVDVARAGARACDVANALAAPLERAGIERGARCGYPVGLSYPPDWGERTISLRAEDETVLEPDMTFHFMPGLWMDGWGLEITETIRIRDSGPAECLADRPRKLFVKP